MTNQSNQQHRGGQTAPNNNGVGKQGGRAPSGNGSSSSRGGSPTGGPPAAGARVPPQLPDDDPFPSGAGLVWQTDILEKKWFGLRVQELCDDHEFDLSDKPCWRRHKGVVKEFGGLVMGRLASATDAPLRGEATAWNRDEQGGFERALPYLAACSKNGCSLDNPDHVAVNSARLYGTGSKAGPPPAPAVPKNSGGGGQQSGPTTKGGGGQQSGPMAKVSEVVEAKPETQADGGPPVQSHRSPVAQGGAEAPERERYTRRRVHVEPTKAQVDFKKRHGGMGAPAVIEQIRRQHPDLTLAEARDLVWRHDAEMAKAAALVDEGEVVPEAPPGVVRVAPPAEGSRVEASADPGWAAEIARATAVGHAQGIAFAEHLPPTPPDPRKEAAREKAEKEAASDQELYAKLQDPAKTGVQLLVALSRGDHYETVAAVAMAPHAPEEMLVALSEHSELIVVKAVAATPAALPDEAAVRLATHPDVDVRRIVAARPHPSLALQQAIVDQDDMEARITLLREHHPMELDGDILLMADVEQWEGADQVITEEASDWWYLGHGPDPSLREQYFEDNPEVFDLFDQNPYYRTTYFAKYPDTAELYYSTRPEMREADQPETPDEPDELRNESPEPDGTASTGSGWLAKAKQKWDQIQEEAAPDPDAPWLPDPNQPTFREWLRQKRS